MLTFFADMSQCRLICCRFDFVVQDAGNDWLVFIRSLDELKAKDGFLSLPNNVNFVNHMNSPVWKGRVFVRKCYEELADLIFECKKQMVAITGTPGIGKTLFRNYLAWRILHQHPDNDVAIVFHCSPGDSPMIMVSRESKEYKARESQSRDAKALFSSLPVRCPIYYLLDVSLGDSTKHVFPDSHRGREFRSCMFTSPAASAYSESKKQGDLSVLYMPVWSLVELKAGAPTVPPLSPGEIERRFEKYGGVARPVYSDNGDLQKYDDDLQQAVKALTPADAGDLGFKSVDCKDIRHRLTYFDVKGKSFSVNVR